MLMKDGCLKSVLPALGHDSTAICEKPDVGSGTMNLIQPEGYAVCLTTTVGIDSYPQGVEEKCSLDRC